MNDLTSFVGHNSIGDFPSILSASKLPLFSIKSSAQSPCPSSHALCKGVLPWESFGLTLDFASNNSWIILMYPPQAARCLIKRLKLCHGHM